MSGNLTSVELQSYYAGLTKKEKSEFLKFLMVTYDYGYSSLQQKLSGGADLNKRDEILIGNVVNSESWKQ